MAVASPNAPGTYRLAYEWRRPWRTDPGMISTADPEIAFGTYRFDRAAEIWRWEET